MAPSESHGIEFGSPGKIARTAQLTNVLSEVVMDSIEGSRKIRRMVRMSQEKRLQ